MADCMALIYDLSGPDLCTLVQVVKQPMSLVFSPSTRCSKTSVKFNSELLALCDVYMTSTTERAGYAHLLRTPGVIMI